MTSTDDEPKDARPHIWIDAQLPPALARWLKAEHDVEAVHIEELGLLRAKDPEIFQAGRDWEREVVILTKDEDFPKLLRQHGPPPKVVWVRCGNVKNQELRSIMLEAWPPAEQRLAEGECLVEIRRRLIPAGLTSQTSC